MAQGFYLNYNDFLKEEAKATKCSEGTRNTERKIEELLGEDQFGFRRGKGSRDGTGMLRIISQRTLDIAGELCTCCIDWQKIFDRLKWTI